MHDQTLVNLLTAKRLAERQMEIYQEDNSKKWVKLPQHTYEKLIEAAQAILLEEIQT